MPVSGDCEHGRRQLDAGDAKTRGRERARVPSHPTPQAGEQALAQLAVLLAGGGLSLTVARGRNRVAAARLTRKRGARRRQVTGAVLP
jgi:hypothetical protein